MRTISSRHNPIVSRFRALARTPDPYGAELLLDGAHLVREAHSAAVPFELVVVAAARLDADTEEGALARALERDGVDVVSASDRIFEAISPVRSPTGIAAIVRRQPTSAADVCGHNDALVIAAVDVQDPGNIGSLLRSAEAGGATGVLACGTSASPFAWKALRGSMGTTLRLPVVAGIAADEALACMTRAGLRTVAAVARGGRDPDGIDWQGRVGLLLGGEGPGLTDALAARCDDRVTIPMTPPVESLNVAVSAGILVYAARRQRAQRDRVQPSLTPS